MNGEEEADEPTHRLIDEQLKNVISSFLIVILKFHFHLFFINFTVAVSKSPWVELRGAQIGNRYVLL